MSTQKGDPAKQPPECPNRPGAHGIPTSCPHIKNPYEGFEGERWTCERCGLSFFLDYEDMK